MKKILLFALVSMSCVVISCKDNEVTPPPTITSFTPNNGVSTATVIITGTNFSTTATENVVKFNGTTAVVTASTATSITTTVPANATSGTISVAVGDQAATSTDNFRVDLLFKATMNKNDEPGTNTSTGTGTTLLTYNLETKIFTLAVTYAGLTGAATNAHIHKGVAGVSGPVVFPFASPFTSPILYTSPVLTADQQTDLMAGSYYVNIHTAAYTGGEIRGTLIKQ